MNEPLDLEIGQFKLKGVMGTGLGKIAFHPTGILPGKARQGQTR
jgi:hypothetical protein